MKCHSSVGGFFVRQIFLLSFFSLAFSRVGVTVDSEPKLRDERRKSKHCYTGSFVALRFYQLQTVRWNNPHSVIEFQNTAGARSVPSMILAWLAVNWIKRQCCSVPANWVTSLKAKCYTCLARWITEMKKYPLDLKPADASALRPNPPATLILCYCSIILMYFISSILSAKSFPSHRV